MKQLTDMFGNEVHTGDECVFLATIDEVTTVSTGYITKMYSQIVDDEICVFCRLESLLPDVKPWIAQPWEIISISAVMRKVEGKK